MEDGDMDSHDGSPRNDETNSHELQNQPQDDASKTKKTHRRGSSRGIKPGVPRIIEWDELNRPIGKWLKDFKAHVGEISQAKVSILIDTWDEVPQRIKDTLWEDIKREFQLEEDAVKKEKVLSTCDKRWKDFKTKLVSGWITCTRKMRKDKRMPYELYDFISKDTWEAFVDIHTWDTFKAINEKAKKSQSFNKYPHHLGQHSYAKMDGIWRRKWYLPSSLSSTSSTSSVVSSFPDRTNQRLVARSGEDSKGNLYLLDAETQKDLWRKKKDGEFVEKRLDDILVRAVGKRDCPGRAFAYGGGERRIAKKGRKVTAAEIEELEARVTQRVRQEIIEEMKSKIETIVEDKFLKLAQELGISHFMEAEKSPVNPHEPSSCHSEA